MNSLTIIEKSAIEKMPVQLKQVAQAKFSTPIKFMKPIDLATEVKNLIIVAYTELGITLEKREDTITFLRDTLVKDFRMPKYEHISFELIKVFVSNGIRGEYGTFKNQLNTINVQNIHHWIKEGFKSETYKRAQQEFKDMVEKENNPQRSMSEKLMFSKDGCIKAFESYKSSKRMPFAAFAYYDIINDLIGVDYKGKKTLVTDFEVRKEITTRLTERHTQELLHEREKAVKRGNLSEAEAIMSAITSEFKEGNSLTNLIKAEFLTYYFDQLIKENKPLQL